MLLLAFLVGTFLMFSIMIRKREIVPFKVVRIIYGGVWRTWYRSSFRLCIDAVLLLCLVLFFAFKR